MENGVKSGDAGRTLCRVFLCHNSADKPSVKEIADRLELDFGILHFLDAFDIPTGEAFRIWIERALKESTGCAIFLGANGWGPTHHWEAEQAIARRSVDAEFRLIPVTLPGVRDEDMNALGDGSVFRDLNWADLRNGVDDQDGLDKLHAALTGQALSEGRGPARLTPYQVRRDAARWMKSLQRDTSILYRGAQLEQAERLARSIPELATKSEVAPFLLASAHRQRSLWRRVAVIAVSASLAIAGLGILAEVLREVAEQRRVLAFSRELAMESRAEQTPATSLLLAAQAYAEMNTPETTGNLLERIQTWPHLVRLLHTDVGGLTKTVWMRDSSVLAGSFHGHLLHWSAESSKADGGPLRASTGAIYSLVVDDEDRVWAGYEDGRVLTWDKAGQRTPVIGIPPGSNLDQIGQVNSLALGPRITAIALSPDGKLSAVGTGAGSGIGQIFLIDRKSKTVIGPPIPVGVPRVNALAFDPRSEILAAATGFGSVVIIDTESRKVIQLKGPHLGEALAVLIAGDRLIAVGDAGVVAVWHRAGGSFELADQFKANDALTSVAIRPDGKAIALGDSNGQVYLYSVSRHTRTSSFQAHTGPVYGLAWEERGDRLASTGSDGAVGIWDLRQLSPLSHAKARIAPNVLALRAINNQLLAGRSSVGSAGIWQSDALGWTLKIDLLKATLAVLGQDRFKLVKPNAENGFVPVPNPEIERIAIDNQCTRVIWVTSDGAVLASSLSQSLSASVLYDGKTSGESPGISLSPSGRYVAIADATRHVLLFDLSQAAINVLKLIDVPDAIRSLNFNPFDTFLAAGFEDGTIALYSVPDGANVTAPTKIHDEPAGNVTFSSDGSRLFSNAVIGDGKESSVTASPVPSLRPSMPLVARASGSPPAMIKTEAHTFATIDNDGRISVWDSDKLAPLGFVTVSDLPLNAAAFDPESGQLLVADYDGWIRSLDVGGAKWETLACTLANRPLSKEEWAGFLGNLPYEATCGGNQRSAVRTPLVDLWHLLRLAK
jgi:WD40 repeat protein